MKWATQQDKKEAYELASEITASTGITPKAKRRIAVELIKDGTVERTKAPQPA